MALQFNKLEPVRFGDKVVEPIASLGNEQRLRLEAAGVGSQSDLEETAALLSQCFATDREYVRQFILENLTTLDMARLKTYLLQGEYGLELMEKALSKNMNDLMAEARGRDNV